MKRRSGTVKNGHDTAPRSGSKALRDTKIRELAAEGRTNLEIAEKLGIERKTVAKVLNNPETLEIVKRAEAAIHDMVPLALSTLVESMSDRINPARERVAMAVLKSVGALRDKVELAHQFPEPVVIRRRDGEKVILGTRTDAEVDATDGE